MVYHNLDYIRDASNLLDALIAIASIVELELADPSGSNTTSVVYNAVRVLRTIRVLRILKVLRYLAFMRIIIGVLSRSLKSFIYIALLLLILIFIYTLLGIQLFAGKFNFPNNPYRESFDSLFPAFLTVFQLMTIENWNEVLHLALNSSVNKIISLAYLISWIFIGNFIFLNLFLAIILDEFSSKDTQKDEKELENGAEDDSDLDDEAFTAHKTIGKKSSGQNNSKFFGTSLHEFKSSDQQSSNHLENHEDELIEEKGKKNKFEWLVSSSGIECRESIFLFTQKNFLRKLCIKIVKHEHFEKAIMAFIFLSSVKLAVDTYFVIGGSDTVSSVFAQIDLAFNVLFITECVIKIIAYGFVFCKGSYLRDYWNILDFSIVVASTIDMLFSGINIPFVKVS